MHQKYERYSELAEKWLNGTITDEEKIEFSEWYNKLEEEDLTIPRKFAISEEDLRERILSQIKRQKRTAAFFSLANITRAKLAVASVGVFLCGFSVYYFFQHKPFPRVNDLETSPVAHIDSVLPGGNKAVLISGDGTQVLLDTAGSGIVAGNASAKVFKLADGSLACSAVQGTDASITYSTLKTPRGGQYSITLIDGTKVWLNSASSLRFPALFKDSERIVQLTGEAYFEVAHNAYPFKVVVNGVEVKVLGTHFNIMAYKEEAVINTTLLEGSVSISQDKRTHILEPGQQARINETGRIDIIKNADTEQVIAWKNGAFNFNGSDIQTIMRQIARWYDIEVVYNDKITEHFNGTILRNTSIEKVLKILEHTGVVRFNMQGRKIFVHS